MELQQLRPANLVYEDPKFDDILLCGACGFPSKVTLLGTALVTDEEFAALTDDEQADLNFAQRAIKKQVGLQ